MTYLRNNLGRVQWGPLRFKRSFYFFTHSPNYNVNIFSLLFFSRFSLCQSTSLSLFSRLRFPDSCKDLDFPYSSFRLQRFGHFVALFYFSSQHRCGFWAVSSDFWSSGLWRALKLGISDAIFLQKVPNRLKYEKMNEYVN